MPQNCNNPVRTPPPLTQVRPFADPAEFRQTLETSLANLDVECIDLFGFHGINRPEHLEVSARVRACGGGGRAGGMVGCAAGADGWVGWSIDGCVCGGGWVDGSTDFAFPPILPRRVNRWVVR